VLHLWWLGPSVLDVDAVVEYVESWWNAIWSDVL
jgi:hypothetical protein